jgi:hypothetical protein
VANSKIGTLNVVDSGDGLNYAKALAMYPTAVAEVLRETGKAIGVDMAKLLSTDPNSASRGVR